MPVRLSRRQFIQGLAVAGGAGAALGALELWDLVAPAAEYRVPFTPPQISDFNLQGRGNDTSVLVLGAGVAGLTAAYELEKAGYRCQVIEARTRPGGRNWTIRGGTRDVDLDGVEQGATFAEGLYMNAGPARIPQHHTTLDYCRELGVPIGPFANVNADAYFYTEPGGFASGPLTGRPIRHRTARADLYGYTSELLAKVANQGALDLEVSGADREALVEYLRLMGALGPEDRYLGSGRRGFTSQPGAGDQPVLLDPPFNLSDLLAAGFGYFFPFELEWDQAMMMFQPVGGMDRIPYALADRIRGDILYGCEVQSIRSADDAVAVTYTQDGSNETEVRADFAVCTIPPPILTRITNDFSDEVIRDLAGISMMTTAKMGLEYKRRFWEEDEQIFGGITSTNLDISTIWYPSSGYLTDRGILIGYYNYMGDAAAFDALGPSERTARAIEQGRKIHGDAYQNEFVSSFSAQWSRIKYSEGGWGYIFDETGGALRRLGEPQRRVYFAGDHISQVSSWQHGAFESARQAVNKLHQRVLNG